MQHQRQVKKLAKFLAYVLGRRPDEFGLCPDEAGYVTIKELIKAIGEEPGWRHIRRSHIQEVMAVLPEPSVEMDGHRIRAVDRGKLIAPRPAKAIPKLLYHPVRRRAYPVVAERGIPSPGDGKPILLAREQPMAERVGRRIDSMPVILTVNTAQLNALGGTLHALGDNLFLTASLPAGSFSGPPLPASPPETKRTEPVPPAVMPKTPGSFYLDIAAPSEAKPGDRKKRRPRKNEWKRERKRRSRQ